ncbi:ABC transporter ATP-binding protein [Roseococcus sp. DSY-14]|uniref:ABC transporter ATP-binding protein n=1 Tax=Roseococcus sp. DSY-14 TaxID=3369650 RepID=UPI00387B94B3
MTDVLIEAEGLVRRFGGITAVNGVSFAVRRGEVVGFLGPNGAGKTTTMRLLAGFLAPSAGTARIAGHDVQADGVRARAALGYLPEGAPAYGEMSVEGFLRFCARVRGRGDVAAAMAMAQLDGVARRPIETLSKGFRRRVGLAAALLHDPDALILDEPTDGLDPNQKHEVRALIRAMAPRKAILVSTHILEEVGAVCTRAIIIAGGQLRADATPAELTAGGHGLEAVFRALTLGEAA